jgi:hypothetical protein
MNVNPWIELNRVLETNSNDLVRLMKRLRASSALENENHKCKIRNLIENATTLSLIWSLPQPPKSNHGISTYIWMMKIGAFSIPAKFTRVGFFFFFVSTDRVEFWDRLTQFQFQILRGCMMKSLAFSLIFIASNYC